MRSHEESRSVIGFRTAMILFATLVVICFAALNGTALVIALIIVFALAAKAYVHHLRNRIERL
jgi:predicted membrane protein